MYHKPQYYLEVYVKPDQNYTTNLTAHRNWRFLTLLCPILFRIVVNDCAEQYDKPITMCEMYRKPNEYEQTLR